MRYITGLGILLTVLVGLSAPAGAQLIINPSSSCEYQGVEMSPALAYSKTSYESDSGDTVDIERILTGLYGAWGLNDWFDLYMSFGYIANAEPDPDEGEWDDHGDGFVIGAGIRGVNWENDYISVMSYAQISYLSEDYGTTASTDAEGEATEVALGAMAKGYLADRFSVYGGVEFVPYTDGKFDTTFPDETGTRHKVSTDMERENPVGIRLGANCELDKWWLRGELGVISETSVLLGAGFMF